MLSLGLDTTGRFCSAALVNESSIVAYITDNISRGHAEHLPPMVHSMLNSVAVSTGDLTCISVCSGPGSFTGARTALSFAKGLALPNQTKLVGVSALEVWAKSADPEGRLNVIPFADIRRGEYMSQSFKKGIKIGEPIRSTAAPVESIAETLVVGGGFDGFVCPAILAWLGQEADSETYLPQPLYQRPPDAKLPGGKSL